MLDLSLYTILIIGLFIIGITILLFVVANEYQSIKLARRFDNFSMRSYNEHEISFFDKFILKLNHFIKKITNVLKKSHVLSDYAKHYEKYIAYKDTKESMDYISIKFILGFFFLVLNILVVAFGIQNINPISFLLTFLIGFFFIDILLIIEFKKKKKEIEEDLLKAIIIMNNSFKSGKNIMQAISTVKNELEGPIADEFKKIYMDITYGLSLEVVFNRFYERVKLEDAKYIAASLTLLNKTGGNIVHVFATIEKSFFNKKKMHDELNSLTASSIFVFRILVSLPPVFTLVIFVLNPTYFHPLFQSPIGIVLLVLILLLYSLYIVVIKKVLEVKM